MSNSEIVAIRCEDIADHEHIIKVKLAGGAIEDASDVIAAINNGETYVAFGNAVRVQQCPDCAEEVLFA